MLPTVGLQVVFFGLITSPGLQIASICLLFLEMVWYPNPHQYGLATVMR